ncbi:MAG: hypothetical protein ICV73_01470 [Acetobacteraceae bacterium]|nr:hypothetical protein [Acetobacteraceae bacterium]
MASAQAINFNREVLRVRHDGARNEGAPEMGWRWWFAAFVVGLVLEAFIIGPDFADDLPRLAGGTIAGGIMVGALLRVCVKVARAVWSRRSGSAPA